VLISLARIGRLFDDLALICGFGDFGISQIVLEHDSVVVLMNMYHISKRFSVFSVIVLADLERTSTIS
jgi:hypothetical protein